MTEVSTPRSAYIRKDPPKLAASSSGCAVIAIKRSMSLLFYFSCLDPHFIMLCSGFNFCEQRFSLWFKNRNREIGSSKRAYGIQRLEKVHDQKLSFFLTIFAQDVRCVMSFDFS